MRELILLGGLDLREPDGESVHPVLSHPKSVALLVFLALSPPGRVLSRDRILSVFWPESPESRARNALSQSLHLLRRGLGTEIILNRGQSGLHLNRDGLWCDASAFQEAAAAGEHEAALKLYAGDLLEGFHLTGETEFRDWLDRERLRLRELAARSAWNLAHEQIQRGRLTDAERTAQRALDLVSTDEAEVRSFIQDLARGGDRAAAVGFYDRFARRIKETLELEPDSLTRSAVDEIRETDVLAAPGLDATAGDDRLGLAALPWVNHTGKEEDRHFTDGLHEEILSRLSRIGRLRVIARPSVMGFRDSDEGLREMAARLGVRYLLTGGLIRSKDEVRINVQLVDGRSDCLLWADTFQQALTMENLLSVQKEIARRVAGELSAALSSGEETGVLAPFTGDLEAYELYLLARYRWVTRSPARLREAIRLFEAALARDPAFALAWVGIAEAWIALPWYEPVSAIEARQRSQEAAESALRLDDSLAEVHSVLGGQAFFFEWEWKKAEEHLQTALLLNPNYAQAYQWLAMAQGVQGRFGEAIDSIRKGISLNPLGNNFHGTLAAMLVMAGEAEEGLSVYRTAAEFKPPIPNDLLCMSVLLFRQGEVEEAKEAIRRWAEGIGYSQAHRLSMVLEAFHAPREVPQALSVIEDVRKTTGLHAGFLTPLYLNLDAGREARKVVGESIANRQPTVPFLFLTPLYAELSRNRELAAMVEEAGIPLHSPGAPERG